MAYLKMCSTSFFVEILINPEDEWDEYIQLIVKMEDIYRIFLKNLKIYIKIQVINPLSY